MQGELQSILHDLLSEETVRRRGGIECPRVRRLVDENTSGVRDYTLQLWSLSTMRPLVRRETYESGVRMRRH
jgi:hypothetical protein